MFKRLFYMISTLAWDVKYRLQKDHSQFGEQQFLVSHLPKDLSNVSYLDIGAHTPVKCSNSFFLYRAGSSGIAIDPITSFALHWSAWRPRDLFLNRVVTGPGYQGDGFINFFRASRAKELLSTASNERQQELSISGTKFNVERIRVVDIVSLLGIFYELYSSAPTLLLVDVEGMDRVLIEAVDQCMDSRLLPDFIFFEQLDQEVDELILTKYSPIAKFVPDSENHARSLLFKRNSSVRN